MTSATSTKLSSKTVFELFLISLLSLYFELLIIRWLSSEVRIFAYFKNMPLMASLFGLGAGLALTQSKRDYTKWFPVGILALTVIICYAEPLNLVHITFIDPLEHYFLGISENFSRSAGQLVWGLVVLTGIFYLIVLTFVGLGQCLGKIFDQFKPLVAYSINVGASLVGIGLFSAVSFLSWRPHEWLIVGILLSLWFYRKFWQIGILGVAVVVACITAPSQVIWSPYYRIHLQDWWFPPDGKFPGFKYGTNINVNHDFIEGAWDNRQETYNKLSPNQKIMTVQHYLMLYQLIGDKPRDVLILAAGAGNDVAMALRHGARRVDAVEIDPVIVGLGKVLNVERPYQDPRTHLIVDDARAYLHRADRKYDLVDFAYLDSHSAFSSMSSIRLDNYVYTVESFRDAARLLKPDGIMAVTFWAPSPWQTARIYKNLKIAMGEEPLGAWTHNLKTLTFLVGPGLNRAKLDHSGFALFDKDAFQRDNAREIPDWDSITPSTDDWPYLFLRKREVTLTYASGLLFTLLVGCGFMGKIFGKLAVNPMGRTMFFLGAGFMLVEVKCVSQLGLLLGTTWLVNSAAVAAILLMILIANLLVMRSKVHNVTLLYTGLILSLLIGYLVPLSTFHSLPFVERAIAGSCFLSLPIVFAAPIFAVTFRRADTPHDALGMNLLGTLVGGLMEYVSMISGISALNLVAIAIYLLSWFFSRDLVTPLAQAAEIPAQAGQ